MKAAGGLTVLMRCLHCEARATLHCRLCHGEVCASCAKPHFRDHVSGRGIQGPPAQEGRLVYEVFPARIVP